MKTDRKRNTIHLSHAETRKWESGTPAGHEFRRRVRDIAHGMAIASNRRVEIYASAKDGGWLADQIGGA